MKKKPKARDIEKRYSIKQLIKKLHRLADALESGKNFSIQIASQKIYVPSGSLIR